MRGLIVIVGLFAVAFVAGCGFNPHPKDGKLSCSEGCPSGYQCRADNFCYRTNAPLADSGSDGTIIRTDSAAPDLGVGGGDGPLAEAGRDSSADGSRAIDVGTGGTGGNSDARASGGSSGTGGARGGTGGVGAGGAGDGSGGTGETTATGGMTGSGGTTSTGGTGTGGIPTAGGTTTTGGTTANGGTTSAGGTTTTGGMTATTSSGGSLGGAGGSGGSGATAACIGNVTDAFTTLAPYWTDQSTACGSVAVSNGTLELMRQGSCANPPSSNRTSALINLDTSRWALCGDFDITVDFSLLAFAQPQNSWHATALRVCNPAGSPGDLFDATKGDGMTLEYLSSINTPHARYNSYTTNANQTAYVATSDTQGRYRMTRVGSLVNAYYWSAGAWTLIKAATLHNAPWTIEFYISADSVTSDDVVDFSGLTIVSSNTP